MFLLGSLQQLVYTTHLVLTRLLTTEREGGFAANVAKSPTARAERADVGAWGIVPFPSPATSTLCSAMS